MPKKKQKKIKSVGGREPEVADVSKTSLEKEKRPNTGDKDDSDEDLEALVLGSETDFLNSLKKADPESSDDEGPEEASAHEDPNVKKPAWVDDDDETEIKAPIFDGRPGHLKRRIKGFETTTGTEYQKRLKGSFEKSTALVNPSWAAIKKPRKIRFQDSDGSSGEDEDEWDLSRRTGNYVAASQFLPRETLQYKRLKDATFGYRIPKSLKSVEFHKDQPLLLVAGHTQKAAIMKIDKEGTSEVQSAAFEKFPIDCARFSSDGHSVVLTSSTKTHFFSYNLLSGKTTRILALKNIQGPGQPFGDGNFALSSDGKLMAASGLNGKIHILSAKSFEWIGDLQANKTVRSLVFNPLNPEELFTHGDEGQVYMWDVGERSVSQRFMDEGCVKGTSLALSPNGRLLATGNNSGVVNLYETEQVRSSKEPKPIKSFMNLVTAADILTFNPSSEILAMGSAAKETQIKMAHLKSRTVFSNFPEKKVGLKKLNAFAFSPHSGYFSAANNEGRAFLFRLHHYQNL